MAQRGSEELRLGLAVSIFLMVLLAAYGGILTGRTFFTYDDPEIVNLWTSGNALGNGWRADVGFGESFFFGDPGSQHPWSPLSLIERLPLASTTVFGLSNLALFFVAIMAQYLLLRRLFPGHRVLCLLLAPLVVLNPLQDKFFFQRLWVMEAAGTALLIYLAHSVIERGRWSALYPTAFVSAAILLFGSVPTFLSTHVAVGTVLVCLAFAKWRRNEATLSTLCTRIVFIFAAAGFGAVLLGFWTFYSIAVEHSLIDHVRDPIPFELPTGSFVNFLRDDLLLLINHLHLGWVGREVNFPGRPFLQPQAYANVAIVFPPILVWLIARRVSDGWIWAMLAAAIIFGLNYVGAFDLIYVFLDLFAGLHYLRPRVLVYPAYHVIQIVLILYFIVHAAEWFGDRPHVARRFAVAVIAGISCLFYTVLLFFAVAVIVCPSWTQATVDGAAAMSSSQGLLPVSADLAGTISQIVIERLNKEWGFATIAFFALTSTLALSSIRMTWLYFLVRRPAVFAGLILLDALAMTHAMFSPVEGRSVWNDATAKGVQVASLIAPTDRLVRIEDRSIDKTIAYFRSNWQSGEFGPYEFRIGYELPPGLSLSTVKTFSDVHVRDFIEALSGAEDKTPLAGVRSLSRAPLEAIGSPMFAIGAVGYLYSERPLPDQASLELLHKSKQFYLYRNKDAWPYIYVTDRVRSIESIGDLRDAEPGNAYVFAEDMARLPAMPPRDGKAKVRLSNFSYGDMTFEVTGAGSKLVVVADAWHPFWRARDAQGRSLPVIKVNGIFKGIVVPDGAGKIRLWFDTGPFLPGLAGAGIAWLAFLLIGIGMIWRDGRKTAEIH